MVWDGQSLHGWHGNSVNQYHVVEYIHNHTECVVLYPYNLIDAFYFGLQFLWGIFFALFGFGCLESGWFVHEKKSFGRITKRWHTKRLKCWAYDSRVVWEALPASAHSRKKFEMTFNFVLAKLSQLIFSAHATSPLGPSGWFSTRNEGEMGRWCSAMRLSVVITGDWLYRKVSVRLVFIDVVSQPNY